MCYTKCRMSGRDVVAFGVSGVVHAALVVGLLAVGFFGGCATQEKKPAIDEIPVEFLVVTEENAADKLSEEPNDAVVPEPPPPPEPEPLPPPPPPEPPKEVAPPPTPVEKKVEPPPPPPPPVEKKVEPKPEKKPEPKPEKKPEKKKEEAKKPEKKKPVPIKISKERFGPVVDGKKNKAKAPTQKAPSEVEIRKLLAQGAKSGNKTQVPKNEAQRGLGLIKSAFKEKCDSAGLEASPTGKNPTLKVSFAKGGRVTKIVIAQSSGDRAFDNKILMQCRQVKRVSGLSESFIKQFETIEVVLQ